MTSEIKVVCDIATKTWLNCKEAELYTTFGDTTMREARDLNKLAFHLQGRKIVYKRTDLDLWLDGLEYHINGRIKNQNKR